MIVGAATPAVAANAAPVGDDNDAAPIATSPAATFTTGADGGVTGTAKPNDRRALSDAVCACTIATVSIAAPTPPAADIANPADADDDTPALAGPSALSPNDAASDALAPTSTPAEIPIPAPAEIPVLKSIDAPACNDSELLAPICPAIPRHAPGSRPIRTAKSAADSPA